MFQRCFISKPNSLTSEDGSVQWVVVERWASNEATIILTGDWCGFVFRTRVPEGKCWISTMRCAVMRFYDEISMSLMGEQCADLSQIHHLENCYRDELMWWATMWLWVVMKLRWSVMELRCALLLATRPYACNYMEFSFQGKFLLSYNRMIFVIFVSDNTYETRCGLE